MTINHGNPGPARKRNSALGENMRSYLEGLKVPVKLTVLSLTRSTSLNTQSINFYSFEEHSPVSKKSLTDAGRYTRDLVESTAPGSIGGIFHPGRLGNSDTANTKTINGTITARNSITSGLMNSRNSRTACTHSSLRMSGKRKQGLNCLLDQLLTPAVSGTFG